MFDMWIIVKEPWNEIKKVRPKIKNRLFAVALPTHFYPPPPPCKKKFFFFSYLPTQPKNTGKGYSKQRIFSSPEPKAHKVSL